VLAAEAPIPAGERIDPDPERHARYTAALQRHRSLDTLLGRAGNSDDAALLV
jgi:hypothetical protein